MRVSAMFAVAFVSLMLFALPAVEFRPEPARFHGSGFRRDHENVRRFLRKLYPP